MLVVPIDDDLFGSPRAVVDRHLQVVRAPRKKIGHPTQRLKSAPTVRAQPEMSPEWEQYNRVQFLEFLVWAGEELERWKDRLPAAEYEKQALRLQAMRTQIQEGVLR